MFCEEKASKIAQAPSSQSKSLGFRGEDAVMKHKVRENRLLTVDKVHLLAVLNNMQLCAR